MSGRGYVLSLSQVEAIGKTQSQLNLLLRALGLSASALDNLSAGVLTHHENSQFVELSSDVVGVDGTYPGWRVQDVDGTIERQLAVRVRTPHGTARLSTCAVYRAVQVGTNPTTGEGVFLVPDAPPAVACDDESSSSSSSGSGSDSDTDTGTGCTAITVRETMSQREGDSICHYQRTVSLNIVNGCLTRDEADWEFVGCACECPPDTPSSGDEEGSSSGDVPGPFESGCVSGDWGTLPRTLPVTLVGEIFNLTFNPPDSWEWSGEFHPCPETFPFCRITSVRFGWGTGGYAIGADFYDNTGTLCGVSSFVGHGSFDGTAVSLSDTLSLVHGGICDLDPNADISFATSGAACTFAECDGPPLTAVLGTTFHGDLTIGANSFPGLLFTWDAVNYCWSATFTCLGYGGQVVVGCVSGVWNWNVGTPTIFPNTGIPFGDILLDPLSGSASATIVQPYLCGGGSFLTSLVIYP